MALCAALVTLWPLGAAHDDPPDTLARSFPPEAVQVARRAVVQETPGIGRVIARGGGSEFSRVIANRMYSWLDSAAAADARASCASSSRTGLRTGCCGCPSSTSRCSRPTRAWCA